jgi:hypothetical protein
MLIQNYGLFWLRSDVYWGKQNSEGHLKGVWAKEVTSKPVDFRSQQGVYVLYDDAFHLVYVGQAGANDNQRLFVRLRQHTRELLTQRWSRFSWFGVRWVKLDGELAAETAAVHANMGDVLNHIEGILISAAEPPHNRQGGRFGSDVRQYLQFRDATSLRPTPAEMIAEMWKGRISS